MTQINHYKYWTAAGATSVPGQHNFYNINFGLVNVEITSTLDQNPNHGLRGFILVELTQL